MWMSGTGRTDGRHLMDSYTVLKTALEEGSGRWCMMQRAEAAAAVAHRQITEVTVIVSDAAALRTKHPASQPGWFYTVILITH